MTVAICVATYARCEGLRQLLESLAALQLDEPAPALRVVVVDNDAAASARAAVEGLKGFPWPCEYVVEPQRGISAARNAAVRAAGYLGATTEIEGYATPTKLFTLDRIRVRDTDTAATLLQRLRSLRSGTL